MERRANEGIDINTYISIPDDANIKQEAGKALMGIKQENMELCNGISLGNNNTSKYTEHVEIYLPAYNEEVKQLEVKLVEKNDQLEVKLIETAKQSQSRPDQDNNKRKVSKCPICRKILSCPSSLKRHINLVHKSHCQCLFCNRTFSSKEALKSHMDELHPNNKLIASGSSSVKETVDISIESPDKKFKKNDTNFLRNELLPSGIQATGATVQVTPAVTVTPIVVDSQGLYECIYCGTKHNGDKAYKKHLNWHEKFQPYKCEICDEKWLTGKDAFDQHMSTHETYSDEQYTCQYCYKFFLSRSDFIKHIEEHYEENQTEDNPMNEGLFKNVLVTSDNSNVAYKNNPKQTIATTSRGGGSTVTGSSTQTESVKYAYVNAIDLMHGSNADGEKVQVRPNGVIGQGNLFQSNGHQVVLSGDIGNGSHATVIQFINDNEIPNGAAIQSYVDLLNDPNLANRNAILEELCGKDLESISENGILPENLVAFTENGEMLLLVDEHDIPGNATSESNVVNVPVKYQKSMSGYQLFTKICFQNGGMEHKHPNERLQEVCKKWNGLSDAEKKAYSDQAKGYCENSSTTVVKNQPVRNTFAKPAQSQTAITPAPVNVVKRYPVSGYQLFMKTFFADDALSQIPPSGRMRRISELWNALSDTEKKEYGSRAKELYLDEADGSCVRRKLCKRPNGGVKHISGYQLFTKIFLSNERLGNIPPTERMSIISQKWKALTDLERKEYSTKAELVYTATKAAEPQRTVSAVGLPNVHNHMNSVQPPKTVSGYQLFVKTSFANDSLTNVLPCDKLRKISEMWKALSESEKCDYAVQAKKLGFDCKRRSGTNSTFSGYKLFTKICFKNGGMDSITPNERIVEVSKRWRTLSADEKKEYSDQAKIISENAKEQNRDLKAVLDEYQSSISTFSNTGTSNLSDAEIINSIDVGFQLFSKILFSDDTMSHIPPSGRMEEIAEKWKALSDSEREEYTLQANQNGGGVYETILVTGENQTQTVESVNNMDVETIELLDDSDLMETDTISENQCLKGDLSGDTDGDEIQIKPENVDSSIKVETVVPDNKNVSKSQNILTENFVNAEQQITKSEVVGSDFSQVSGETGD